MASYPRRRANGEGSLYRTGSGRWRGAVCYSDAAGRTRRRTVSAATQAEARRRLDVLRAEMGRGLAADIRTTVADFLARWLVAERQRVRPSTWRQREQYVRVYIVPALGRLPVGKLAPADVERMTAGLIASGRSPRTAAHARTILRRALGDAARDGLVTRNVAALARPPRVEQPAIRYLAPADLRALLAGCEGHPFGPLYALAATTGLRQGELLGLAWEDVNLDDGRLTVRRALARDWQGYKLAEPKTPRSRRTIHLPARAVDALRRQMEAQDAARTAAGTAWQDRDGLAFTDAVGRPLRGYTVNAALTGLLAALGLPHIPFHGLRHSAATALLAGGVPLRVVSDLLGHASLTITAASYAAVVPELRRDAAEAMDRVLGDAP